MAEDVQAHFVTEPTKHINTHDSHRLRKPSSTLFTTAITSSYSSKPELPWYNIVHVEILNVVAAMRKNQRWSIANSYSRDRDVIRDSLIWDARNQNTLSNDITEFPYAKGRGTGVGEYDYLVDIAGFGKSPGLDALIDFAREKRHEIGIGKTQESFLLQGFTNLKARLTMTYVILSGVTTGPITSVALDSIDKFIKYRILDPDHPGLASAISALTHSVTHCKFEATDAVSDEIVLAKILRLLRATVTSEAGQRTLNDKGVCDMVEAAFGMCFQSRVSELLRRYAEETLMLLVQSIFERLTQIMGTKEHEKYLLTRLPSTYLTTDSNWSTDPHPFGLPAILELIRVLITLIDPRNRQHTDTIHRMVALRLLNTGFEVAGKSLGLWIAWGHACQTAAKRTTLRPHVEAADELKIVTDKIGVTPVLSLVPDDEGEVVVGLERRISQSIGGDAVAARLVDVGNAVVVIEDTGKESVEVIPVGGGESRRVNIDEYASDDERMAVLVKDLVTNELCRFLFQLINSAGITVSNPPNSTTLTLFSAALRVATTLIQCARTELNHQLEWLLTWSMTKVDMGVMGWDIDEWTTASIDPNSAIHKSPNPAQKQPTFSQVRNAIATIMVGEVRELVLDGIVQNSFPDATPGGPATSPMHQTLCHDVILLFLKQVVDRTKTMEFPSKNNDVNKSEEIAYNKKRKRILMQGADLFNEKLRDSFLAKFLPDPVDAASLASLLKSTSRISKHALGEYLSKPANVNVLNEFMEQFKFERKRIDEALRMLLESFRLPGESQQIERIMAIFAKTYFKAFEGDDERQVADEDSAFLLAYSVILLNTDQHNHKFGAIFDTIRDNEIVMPSEHDVELGFSYTWRELLKKSKSTNQLSISSTSIFDKDMFLAIWSPILASLTYAYDNAEDYLSLKKAIIGFHHCAVIATHYNLNTVFDNVVISLSKITGLLRSDGPIPPERMPVMNGGRLEEAFDKRVIKVDRWAVEFGRNYKAQTAAVLMFSLASEFGNYLRSGWKNILDCIRNLFLHSLLPLTMLEAEVFVQSVTMIPRIPQTKSRTCDHQQQRKETGLLSTITQFLSLSGPFLLDEEVASEPTSEELDCERHTLDCVRACRLEDLFNDSRFLEEEALKTLATSIVKASFTDPETTTTYNEAAVFFLDLLTDQTLQNRDRLFSILPITLPHLHHILHNPTTPLLLLSRATTDILRLVARLSHQDEAVLDLFACLDGMADFSVIAESLMTGLRAIVRDGPSVVVRSGRAAAVVGWCAKCGGRGSGGCDIRGSGCGLRVGRWGRSFGAVAVGEGSPRLRRDKKRANQAVVDRAVKAVEHLYKLHTRIPGLIQTSGMNHTRGFIEFWLPVLSGLSQQTYHPAREIRQHALTHLQRALLSPLLEATQYEDSWYDCFETVLLPLLDELLKPEVARLDSSAAIDETRMRAAALLCKIFLQYVARLIGSMEFSRLWRRILAYLVRYMRASGSELNKGVLESLKNMLLVMATQGLFQAAGTKSFEGGEATVLANELWEVAWKEVQVVAPGLKEELFPILKNGEKDVV
ncbi:GDP/GTP exchange factor for ARF [Nowakowskiella sp. JEL0078]|nr:GDP/GTP exchange factor for ARF [Nowakowskiella sp. JEL0078]